MVLEKCDEEILIYWPECLQETGWGEQWDWCNKTYPPKGSIFMDKDGKYIYLYKENEPNRYFRYDLSTKSFSRINIYKTREDKITPVKVQNLRPYFSRCKIYTKNPLFARIFVFLASHRWNFNYHNPIRYIESFGSSDAQAIEEWYNAGVKIDEVEKLFEEACKSEIAKSRSHYSRLDYRPTDFAKNLLKFFKKKGRINLNTLDDCGWFDNETTSLYERLYHFYETPEFSEAFNFDEYGADTDIFDFTSYDAKLARHRLLEVMKDYNLDPEAICRFLNRLRRVEGCDVTDLTDGYHYRDYLMMEKQLNNENLSRVDKYPKNWLTSFRRTKRNYEDIQKKIDENKFTEEMNKHKDLEYKGKDFCIILPKKSAEIRKEGSRLKHCVASYVGRVTDGKTCILFLRQNEDTTEPFVTIEVKHGSIIQAYGLKDSKPTKEARKFMLQWAKEKNLGLSWRWEKNIKDIKGDRNANRR